MIVGAVIGLTFLLLPIPLMVAIIVWTRRLRAKGRLPAAVGWLAYGLVGLAAVVIVGGSVGVIRPTVSGHAVDPSQKASGDAVDPSQKARILAEGISEVMNCEAFALVLLAPAALAIGFYVWRSRRER